MGIHGPEGGGCHSFQGLPRLPGEKCERAMHCPWQPSPLNSAWTALTLVLDMGALGVHTWHDCISLHPRGVLLACLGQTPGRGMVRGSRQSPQGFRSCKPLSPHHTISSGDTLQGIVNRAQYFSTLQSIRPSWQCPRSLRLHHLCAELSSPKQAPRLNHSIAESSCSHKFIMRAPVIAATSH